MKFKLKLTNIYCIPYTMFLQSRSQCSVINIYLHFIYVNENKKKNKNNL
jgi:hypothetical protein